jgi:hypothetical protein
MLRGLVVQGACACGRLHVPGLAAAVPALREVATHLQGQGVPAGECCCYFMVCKMLPLWHYCSCLQGSRMTRAEELCCTFSRSRAATALACSTHWRSLCSVCDLHVQGNSCAHMLACFTPCAHAAAVSSLVPCFAACCMCACAKQK